MDHFAFPMFSLCVCIVSAYCFGGADGDRGCPAKGSSGTSYVFSSHSQPISNVGSVMVPSPSYFRMGGQDPISQICCSVFFFQIFTALFITGRQRCLFVHEENTGFQASVSEMWLLKQSLWSSQVVISHLFGSIHRADNLIQEAKHLGLLVVEDCAQGWTASSKLQDALPFVLDTLWILMLFIAFPFSINSQIFCVSSSGPCFGHLP